jgi:hypothetical protein
MSVRFSLRTLLFWMSGLSLAFAVMTAVGFVGSLAMLLIGCLAGAHVLGNALGTRLRDESTRASASDRAADFHVKVAAKLPLSAPSRLAERASLHRVAAAVTLGSAAMGGELGAVLAAYTYPESSTAAIGLGAVSLAVVGGFAGFAAISFMTVFRQALREGLSAAKDHAEPPATARPTAD